jgi:hypothetical protein
MHIPVLCWQLIPEGDCELEPLIAVGRSVLEWQRERLAIACPEDLRILSLLLVETPPGKDVGLVHAALHHHDDKLQRESGSRPSFRYREMKPLSGVDRIHLQDGCNPPSATSLISMGYGTHFCEPGGPPARMPPWGVGQDRRARRVTPSSVSLAGNAQAEDLIGNSAVRSLSQYNSLTNRTKRAEPGIDVCLPTNGL